MCEHRLKWRIMYVHMFIANTALFQQKVKASNLSSRHYTFSEESHPAACKYKWIILSLSDGVEADSAVTLLAPGASSEFPDGFFRMPRSFGESSVWSAPLLQVDSQGPRWLREHSHAADTRHWSFFFFLGSYHGNPGRGCWLWTILILHLPPLLTAIHFHI